MTVFKPSLKPKGGLLIFYFHKIYPGHKGEMDFMNNGLSNILDMCQTLLYPSYIGHKYNETSRWQTILRIYLTIYLLKIVREGLKQKYSGTYS